MDKQYQIPSSVASKLEQIKLYMGTHSVTAFVGAGFSMNAEIPNNVSMKTWAQLREVFLDKLYPNNEEDKKNDANDVVRLSSLVDAQFGHNELDLGRSLARPTYPTRQIASFVGAVALEGHLDHELRHIDRACSRASHQWIQTGDE